MIQKATKLEHEFLGRLSQRHRQGAVVRAKFSVLMWFFALLAYLLGFHLPEQFLGISGSVAYLVLLGPVQILAFQRFSSPATYEMGAYSISFLEISGYTAVIHFAGGLGASFLLTIYCALIV